MKPRKFLIAGNWKMNNAPVGAFEKTGPYQANTEVDIVIFPTFLDIYKCLEAGIVTGGQYGHHENEGAHTGDISMQMLANAGCRYVLCGHSERRQDHGETNKLVAEQAIKALEVGLHPVVCVGETAEQREKGKEKKIIEEQLSVLPLESDLTIAYEPVWAIGTGKTATPEIAQKMHAFIRGILPDDRREVTRILYGGSMKPDNAKELLNQTDIDGGLIGGASLKPDQFKKIVEIAVGMQ